MMRNKFIKTTISEFINEKMESSKKHHDLFEFYDEQPIELKNIVDKYEDKLVNGISYDELGVFKDEVEKIGYTFDFGLDASPYGLRPIGVKLTELEGYEDM